MPVNILPKRVKAHLLRLYEEVKIFPVLRIVDFPVSLDRSTENLYHTALFLLHFNHCRDKTSFLGYCNQGCVAKEVVVQNRYTTKNALSTGLRAMSFLARERTEKVAFQPKGVLLHD